MDLRTINCNCIRNMKRYLLNYFLIGVIKTKCLICSVDTYTNVRICLRKNQKIEEVENCTYLKSIISADE